MFFICETSTFSLRDTSGLALNTPAESYCIVRTYPQQWSLTQSSANFSLTQLSTALKEPCLYKGKNDVTSFHSNTLLSNCESVGESNLLLSFTIVR